MTEIVKRIVSFVTEEDDSDWKDVVHPDNWVEGDSWMEHTLKPLGFEYRNVGIRGWEKKTNSRQVQVGSSTNPGKALMSLWVLNGQGRWSSEAAVTEDYGEPVLNRLRAWGIIR